MAKGDDILEKLIRLTVALVRICDQLPETQAGKHIASQLLRSGTSPAPNYVEAGELLPRKLLFEVREKSTVLCKITAASIKTVSLS